MCVEFVLECTATLKILDKLISSLGSCILVESIYHVEQAGTDAGTDVGKDAGKDVGTDAGTDADTHPVTFGRTMEYDLFIIEQMEL